MNKKFLIAGIVFLICGLLAVLFSQVTAQSPAGESESANAPILSACSGSTLLFPLPIFDPPPVNTDDKDTIDRWREEYHGTVRTIIDTHFENRNIMCAAESIHPAGPMLRTLAGKLAPWREKKRLTKLSEDDMGSVLLEYLRVYECSLTEHQQFLMQRVADEVTKDGSYPISVAIDESRDQAQKMREELQTARPILDRALGIVGGMDRLRPVDSDFECLQRSSLDIRNILGLTSEVSACLPRIQDTRGTLRDLPEKTPVTP